MDIYFYVENIFDAKYNIWEFLTFVNFLNIIKNYKSIIIINASLIVDFREDVIIIGYLLMFD